MRATLALAISLLGATLVLAQVEQPVAGKGSEQRHDYAELSKAPDKARMRRNPIEGDANGVAAGRKLFEQHCAECHGATGEGGKKAPSLSAREIQEATPGTLFWLLTNGVVRRGMPVWSKLPEAQRWQLVMYLRTLRMETPTDSTPKTEAK
jgi:mono/diheme cytochrome c family protein